MRDGGQWDSGGGILRKVKKMVLKPTGETQRVNFRMWLSVGR